MIPGMNKITDDQIEHGELQLKRTEAMINSMTRGERQNPGIINNARKKRIAAGSGVTIQDVGKMLNDFETMRTMMQQFGQMGAGGRPPMLGGQRPSRVPPRPPAGGNKGKKQKKGRGFGR